MEAAPTQSMETTKGKVEALDGTTMEGISSRNAPFGANKVIRIMRRKEANVNHPKHGERERPVLIDMWKSITSTNL
ncbi:hypothetical protein PRIPAC_87655 [Pristionchus pacificus]|uniref:Uncharacterized protein n=1 Tax=Pristionchus pacificus TaxID=54126 RepID=A0A2A6CYB2_PRIPA|nr:hypothetical protein PRIPAC_87655 [Pristionchus pacificus]|eukprot:PDM83204.1 hypothetical protein PRIPAC_34836 [Pristionchus pacificus]